MAWENVKVSDVEVKDNKFPPLEAEIVTAALTPTALYRERNGTQQLAFRASIVEGNQRGRQFFMEYPDPESTTAAGKKQDWSAKAFKLLTMALGIDILDGEDPAAYVNRVALEGNARFAISLEPGTYIPVGQTTPKVEAKLFTVRAAA